MNWKCRIRRASVATAAAAAIGAATAGGALASHLRNDYCGVLINPGTWCGDGTNHTYDKNRAEYRGSGSVKVCERLLYADTTVQRNGYSCQIGTVYRDYGLTESTLFEAEVTQTGYSRHTIYGSAWY